MNPRSTSGKTGLWRVPCISSTLAATLTDGLANGCGPNRLRQPTWLSQYFCLDPVPAKWPRLQNIYLEGVYLEPESLIYPPAGSLTMGFTWSLYFAPTVSTRLISMAPSLQGSRLVHDRCQAVVLESSDSPDSQGSAVCSVHHYVYVDNLGILSINRDSVEEVETVFHSHHLVLHPGQISTGSTRALGVDLL